MAGEKEKEEGLKVEEISFECKVCQQSKPLDEMVVITRYFPPLIACRECEKKMR